MAKIVYTAQVYLINVQIYSRIHASSSALFFKQPKYKAEFCFIWQNKNSMLAFHLNEADGDEMFEIEMWEEDTKIASSNQQTCPFDRDCSTVGLPITLDVKCTVTFFMKLQRNNMLIDFVNACKNDPEKLMTFKCGENTIETVLPIMCRLSTVIDAMMNGNFTESKDKTVLIDDYSADVIKKMVEFCENNTINNIQNHPEGKTESKGDDIFEVPTMELKLCMIANKYNIDSLKDYAAVLAIKYITKANLFRMYNFAKTHNNEKLEKFCIECAQAQFSKMVGIFDYNQADGVTIKDFWVAVTEKKTP